MTTLFHYCSLETFQAIIESRSIRLSSLKLSNDSAEGKLVQRVVSSLASNDKLDTESLKHLESGLAFLEEAFEGLGFCLSKAGDLLSQWRGYAADGTGLSIGFNKKYFEQLSFYLKELKEPSFSLQKVYYKSSDQIKLVKPVYEQILTLYKEGKLTYPRPLGLLDSRTEADLDEEISRYRKINETFIFRILELFPILFCLKTEAFKEEQEWRLISYLFKSEECEYKSMLNRLVPFKTLDLIDLQTAPIAEVIIGPKNVTPKNVIERFLNQNGFKNVNVLSSASTYR